ncbi:mitochondrial carrier [Chiua virens]|nr:mitochondrial carrier [Chiua virens]
MANPPQLTRFYAAPEDMNGLLFTFVLISMGVVATSAAIMIPLNGMVIRSRAQYNPKGLQLDSDEQPRTSSVITSSFAMLVRVRRIEGLSGVYKGLVPALLDMLITIFVGVLWSFLMRSGVSGGQDSPVHRVQNIMMLVSSVFNVLIHLPLMIIINRAVTTRHKLPYFNILYSLRVLFTPTERRRPWVLYQTPGIFASLVLQYAYFILHMKIRPRFLLQDLSGQLPREDFLLGLILFFAFTLASTPVLTPLQVIFLRLSLQRNDAAPESNGISLEEALEGGAAEAVEYFGTGENVISLKIDLEGEPYTGLIDCATKITKEEGWAALYRAWWWTMLTLLALS